MFDRQTLSSYAFTTAIAISTACWLLLAYDTKGDPVFDTLTVVLLEASVALIFFTSIWFTYEGNNGNHSGLNLLGGVIAGWVLMLGWLTWNMWGTLPGILLILWVFLIPMLIMQAIHLSVSKILMIFGFFIGEWIRKVRRRRFTA